MSSKYLSGNEAIRGFYEQELCGHNCPGQRGSFEDGTPVIVMFVHCFR